MEYTKGDWALEGLTIKASGKGIIAQCPVPQKGGVFEVVANARLIAAAPDMFEALKKIYKRCYGNSIIPQDENGQIASMTLKPLAKAEGK